MLRKLNGKSTRSGAELRGLPLRLRFCDALPPCVCIVGIASVGCVPLEERVDIVYRDWCAPARQEDVACVYDGDTLDVGECGGESIRLLGVAAPELENATSGTNAECYGEESAAFLREVVEGQQVTLEFDESCTDIYSRTLAWVTLEGDDPDLLALLDSFGGLGVSEDGDEYEVLVNELLIRAGYATVFDGEVNDSIRYTDRLDDAEAEAESDGLGLWSSCD